MKPNRRLMGAAVIAVAIAAGIVATNTTAQSRQTTSQFTLRSVPDNEQAVIDSAPEGPSLGDSFIFADEIYDLANRRRLGHANGFCVMTSIKRTNNQCSLTLYLPGGKIEVATGDNGPPTLLMAIIGGTGKYAGARGTAIVRTLSDDTKSRLTLRLQH